jgi:hypothetical protein
MLFNHGAAADERVLTANQLAELQRALELDSLFRKSFDADPVTAAEVAGWPELARALQREMHELVALAERIAADDAYRAELSADPLGTVVASGIPSSAAEPLLTALGTPDDLLARLPDVVAHAHDPELKARLAILLLGTTAVAETFRSLAARGH